MLLDRAQLYVVWAASFPYEHLVLPLDVDSLPRDFKVLGLDKRALTPPARLLMDEFGVADLISIARRRDGTYLNLRSVGGQTCLRVYLEAHYGVKAVFYFRYTNPDARGGSQSGRSKSKAPCRLRRDAFNASASPPAAGERDECAGSLCVRFARMAA